jgi:uncharacterized protein YjbI with pentapeptide repeats
MSELPLRVPALFAHEACAADLCLWQLSAPRVTVVAKIAFRIVPGEVAPLLERPDIIERDRHADRVADKPVIAAHDLAPVLPGAEVLVTGHVFAPDGRATPSLAAGVTLGFSNGSTWRKLLHVFGDRWSGRSPQPFRALPLSWERALRGHDNPVGVDPTIQLPNFVDPARPEAPAGFGPLAAAWRPRRSLLGSAPPSLFDTEPIVVPPGFDFRYFFAAPLDQRLVGLSGDEWVQLDGLHPLLARVQFRLPLAGLSLRVHDANSFEEYPMVPDRLVIDSDRQVGTLTYRRGLPLDWTKKSDVSLSVGLGLGAHPATHPRLGDATAERGRYRLQGATGTTGDVSPELARLGALPFEELVKQKRQARMASLPLGHQAPVPVAPAESAAGVTVAFDGGTAALGALPFEKLLELAKARKAGAVATPPQITESDAASASVQAPVEGPLSTQPVDSALASLGALPFEELVKLRERGVAQGEARPAPRLEALPFAEVRARAAAEARPTAVAGAESELLRRGDCVPCRSDRGLTVATMPWRFDGGANAGVRLVVIVKGSFQLVEGKPALPLDRSVCLDGDVFADDDCSSALVTASDFVPIKRAVDVLVRGFAFAPKPDATMMKVSLALTNGAISIERSLAVFGDRVWSAGALSLLPTSPSPIERIPLRFDRAFGGPAYGLNPIGRGHQGGRQLPNLEDLQTLIVAPSDSPKPVAFGPLPATSAAREAHLGTYDAAWLESRWPYPPEDFDYGFMQAAPKAQRLERATGEEAYDLVGMHPEKPRLRGKLAALRARAFARRSDQDGEGRSNLVTIPLMLDTITFVPHEERVDLVWRGLVAVSDDDAPELDLVFATYERTNGAPITLELAETRLAAHSRKSEEDERPETKGAPEPKGANDVDEDDVESEARAASIREMLANHRAAMGLPPEPTGEAPSRESTPEEKATAVRTLADAGVPAELVEELARSLERTTAPPPPPAVDLRALVRGRVERGEPLSGLDLRKADLSALDLSRQDLSGSDLSQANLDGANLEGASLAGARLCDARLKRAALSRADLSRADLTGAVLEDADLTSAKLLRAELGGAVLSRATLHAATLIEANLTGALVDDAVLSAADLTDAHLSSCRLSRVTLSKATLVRTRLYEAKAERATFDDADMTNARSDGASFVSCSFARVRADDSLWQRTDLSSTSFALASLQRAGLERANCTDASFLGADLREARLTRALLRRAELSGANAMDARLDRAALDSTKLRGANLHGASLDRVLTNAVELEDAILTRTRWEGRRP